jgi:hypothetical protein
VLNKISFYRFRFVFLIELFLFTLDLAALAGADLALGLTG